MARRRFKALHDVTHTPLSQLCTHDDDGVGTVLSSSPGLSLCRRPTARAHKQKTAPTLLFFGLSVCAKTFKPSNGPLWGDLSPARAPRHRRPQHAETQSAPVAYFVGGLGPGSSSRKKNRACLILRRHSASSPFISSSRVRKGAAHDAIAGLADDQQVAGLHLRPVVARQLLAC